MRTLRSLARAALLRTAPAHFLRHCSGSSAQCGRAGERLALRHLRLKGHRILARNLRHPAAELDLVTATSTHLVLVEVKTGRAEALDLAARFSPLTRSRQRLAAMDLARRHGLLPRLDLLLVLIPRGGGPTTLRHLRDL